MTYQNPPPSAESEKKEVVTPPSTDTRAGLDQLRQGVSDKQNVSSQLWDVLRNFGNMSKPERMQKLGAILSGAALGYIFGKKKEEAEQPKKKARQKAAPVISEPTSDQEAEEEVAAQPTERDKHREVVCNDARLICINTDPAGKLVPQKFRGKSSELLKYGLPNYPTFKIEMIGDLASDTSDEKAGVKKVVDILKRCPMGKYQCMPQYLFQYVEKFKKFNFDWKTGGQEEEKLHAMWEFLQSDKMQKEAARGYLAQSANQYGGDSELVAAAFYGGAKAADALKAYKAGTATPEQKDLVERPQGTYRSILSYSGTSKSTGTFNVEAELAITAGRESGNLEGKKSKPRDEEWEKDQRYAYNQTAQIETNNATA